MAKLRKIHIFAEINAPVNRTFKNGEKWSVLNLVQVYRKWRKWGIYKT